jgi:hypothetical protein
MLTGACRLPTKATRAFIHLRVEEAFGFAARMGTVLGQCGSEAFGRCLVDRYRPSIDRPLVAILFCIKMNHESIFKFGRRRWP